MNDIITISGVRGYIDENGVAQLNAEDVARGGGFVESKGDKQYVMWRRVNGYLQEFGFGTSAENSPQVGKDDFIPENMVYRLGFKANNETAQKFQALLADEVLPTIRKTGNYTTKPMTQLEIIAANAAALVEQERRINEIASRQDKQAEQMQAIRETIVIRPDQKRQWINSTINKIVRASGGEYRRVKTETYQLLNARLGVNIYTRRNNRRLKTGQDVSALEIILADKKLAEGYIAILKEYAIQHGVE